MKSPPWTWLVSLPPAGGHSFRHGLRRATSLLRELSAKLTEGVEIGGLGLAFCVWFFVAAQPSGGFAPERRIEEQEHGEKLESAR